MPARTVTSVDRRRRDGSALAGTSRWFDGKAVGARNPPIGRDLLDSRRFGSSRSAGNLLAVLLIRRRIIREY
jgi:hypothetical protein